MSARLSPDLLDEILALQLTVAWAGEASCEPPRLGWWKSDLVDPEGGGDLFARLVPETARWASLGLVREVARRADEEARGRLARADSVWTLFHFGFAVDEQLADRLAYHRQCRQAPEEALGQGFRVGAWSKGVFEGLLSGLAKPRARITPVGRKVDASAASPAEAAVLLTAALLPLPASYPLPYIEVTA